MGTEESTFHPVKDVWYNLPRGFVKSTSFWKEEDSPAIVSGGKEGKVFSSTDVLFLLKERKEAPVYRFKTLAHVVCVLAGAEQATPMALVDLLNASAESLLPIDERDLLPQKELATHG